VQKIISNLWLELCPAGYLTRQISCVMLEFIITSGAMDHKILEALYRAGVPTFDMGSNMNTFDVGWGTPIFHKMGREKVILVNAFLALEYELLMCDTDVAWMRVHTPSPSFG
jgi:hypothetical protein